MTIADFAAKDPDRPAVVMGDGGVLTYGELETRSARLAQLLRRRGLQEGDRVAAILANGPTYAIVAWATRRCGLRLVPVNWHLTVREAGYIVEDSDARALVVSAGLLDLGVQVVAATGGPELRLTDGAAAQGFESIDEATADCPPEQLPDQLDGPPMVYSSGTTGNPKGIVRPMGALKYGEARAIEIFMSDLYGLGEGSVFLLPAPIYFTAPLTWTGATLSRGAKLVVMERFDAEQALALIERERVTHGFFVPTHFVRMLKLPPQVRARYDTSSLTHALHAGAPCPPEVKREMLEWWGPVLYEYYSGSEGAGLTSVTPREWLARPGTVGKSMLGPAHILDDEGDELPPGEIGTVYFEGAAPFEYHKDPGKTAAFFNDRGWGALGDMGWLDEEGYLFLADRKSNMIISGGVNIYPQEIEAQLTNHPAVFDVAVIGVPHAEFGEEVKALVQAAPGVTPGPALQSQLLEFCRARLAGYKCPRTVDFVETLPRLPNGKLLKRELRQAYWGEGRVQI
jgi:acyl-CoA synthetase (AMP-forming)/AMP-acid ligase II